MTDETKHELQTEADREFAEYLDTGGQGYGATVDDFPVLHTTQQDTISVYRAPVNGQYPNTEIQYGAEFVSEDHPRKQVGGDHYNSHAIQPFDVIDEYGLDFYGGNALKYLLRYPDKGGVVDLEKAKHYIEILIEKENGKSAEAS